MRAELGNNWLDHFQNFEKIANKAASLGKYTKQY